ncbi:hypothetical protein DPMN_007622 [Dreissena polymorpha]|uniref:Helitron helicase-like domain-containing protein n=1 Tax=Dreissena polymorpha TaxID=45954 RepID=A0A9D4MYT6_DREPO|nr:hypothetical protein DPMN_007622 [Dreissena polymorpha]
MSEWAEHLIWYTDGRFAQHKYFQFIVHNIISRKRALEQSTYIMKQQIGDEHMSIDDLKQRIQNGDSSIAQKILYFGASLRGTSQYWSRRAQELRALIQYQINAGKGLPSFFSTASCAEFYFAPLRRLLTQYNLQTTGEIVDLNDKKILVSILQNNSHIVSHYFNLRTQEYFETVMKTAFKVDTFWYRYEFAKSRGMIHFHGLCWRSDREPHNLLHEALKNGLDEDVCASKLSEWAQQNFAMIAMHPAGSDASGNPNKDLWPPPEGNAPAPPESKNPLFKLFMDVSQSEYSILEDHLLLTNKINLHRCSSYCLVSKKGMKHKVCRMEFGSENMQGKAIRDSPAIVKDKNGSLRL